MRKISRRSLDLNIGRSMTPALFGVSLLVACIGCQDQPNKGPDQTNGSSAKGCHVTVNDHAWTNFKSMADRMAHGEAVPAAELDAFGESPVVTAWRHSLVPRSPRVLNVTNWLLTPWRAELGLPAKYKNTSDRAAMSKNYKYSYDHAASIDSLLDHLTNGPGACELAGLINRWLSPEQIPDPLVLNVLPAMAEIRMYEGEVFLDTGVLAAGGLAQTSRSIAALLYRKRGQIPGTNPLETSGEQAVAECLRVMANEGISGWIEQTTHVSFRRDHPSLHKVRIIPTDFYLKAQQTTKRFAEYLPAMFADPAVMAKRGRGFARDMAGGNSFSQTGIAAAELIVGRLGEDRLQQVKSSVPDFWAAFQEAALMNDSPPPPVGTRGVPLYESLAPLPSAVYEPLLALLERHY